MPVALVTGAGRRQGIAAAIARGLASDGWDIGLTCWTPYDAAQEWGADGSRSELAEDVRATGRRCVDVEADLGLASSPAGVFDAIEGSLGPVIGLVVAHCEGSVSSLLDTSIEEFDRHYAVNVRGTWLLVRELARRLVGDWGRLVSLSSDHVAGNVPYGVTKGAMDRVILAAAHELGPRGVTANVINPGPTDTGWMDVAVRAAVSAQTLLPRAGGADDAANLVRFLFSPAGGWITGQLLHSNGGFRSTIA